MSMREFADDLAAGDEVEALASHLVGIQSQLESLGAAPAPSPIGHILVPKTGAGLSLPSGTARIDFNTGRVTHEALGTVVDDLVTVSDLVESSPNEPQLQNLIFHADTLMNVEVGGLKQEIYLQNVPIPESDFSEVKLTMQRPGELTVMASTQRLPIGLGAVTVNGQRHGEHASAVTDSFTAVPVSPFSLWEEHTGTHAEAPVYTAVFDTATWTVDNTGSNALVAEVQAREDILGSTVGEWRTIASDTIPSGDHSVFNVTERHKYQRVRVENDTNGQSIAASVDLMEANP